MAGHRRTEGIASSDNNIGKGKGVTFNPIPQVSCFQEERRANNKKDNEQLRVSKGYSKAYTHRVTYLFFANVSQLSVAASDYLFG